MTWLLYGAYGYTGTLIAQLAAERGLRPILAGRDAGRTTALASALGLPHRVFDLENAARHLDGVAAVLHCAGPFARTAKPMIDACIERGVHYLDITGEIGVFELAHRRGPAAAARGVMLLPGVGFDVVPSDCLAAHVAAALPDACRLALAFQSTGGMSHGTASTMAMHLGMGGAVRQGGVIVAKPPGHARREVDFGDGPQTVVSIPWGDVSTAYYSTGIKDIIVYLSLPASLRWALRASALGGPLLRTAWVRSRIQRRIDAAPAGPTAGQRGRARARLFAEAVAADGRMATASLETPDGYDLTADAAILFAERVVGGAVRPGFQTPSLLLGPDIVLECQGVRRRDVSISGRE